MVKGAWVTLATNDSYSLGALVLAHSLKQVGTQQELAILVTPGVTNSMRAKLSDVFNIVKEVNVLDSKDKANLRLLQRPELGITFTKLHCWQLTEYEKCVFLDADTLVLQNCDELFEREELSAAPDVGWPDCFNSGVFVYRPSEETYNSLIQFALDKGSFDGGDQGLLNLYFADWARKDISKHLPFIYNVCSTAFYSYLPAFKQFGKDVKIIHFIGNAKPWLQYFDTESKRVRPSRDLGHLEPILQKWWNIFCSMIHPNLSPDMISSYPSDHVSARSPDQSSTIQPYNVPPSPIECSMNDIRPNVWDPWEEYDTKQMSVDINRSEHLESHNTIALSSVVPDHSRIDYSNPFLDVPSVDRQIHYNDDSSTNVEPSADDFSGIETVSESNLKDEVFVKRSCSPSNDTYEDITCHVISEVVQESPNTSPVPSHSVENAFHCEESISDKNPRCSNPFLPEESSHEVEETSHVEKHLPVSQSPEEIPPSPEILPISHHSKYETEGDSNNVPCEVENHVNESGLAGAFAKLTLGQQRTPEQEALEDSLRRQNWEQGNIDYLGKDSFDNIWSKICETLAKGPPEDGGVKDLDIASPQQEECAPLKEDVLAASQESPLKAELNLSTQSSTLPPENNPTDSVVAPKRELFPQETLSSITPKTSETSESKNVPTTQPVVSSVENIPPEILPSLPEAPKAATLPVEQTQSENLLPEKETVPLPTEKAISAETGLAVLESASLPSKQVESSSCPVIEGVAAPSEVPKQEIPTEQGTVPLSIPSPQQASPSNEGAKTQQVTQELSCPLKDAPPVESPACPIQAAPVKEASPKPSPPKDVQSCPIQATPVKEASSEPSPTEEIQSSPIPATPVKEVSSEPSPPKEVQSCPIQATPVEEASSKPSPPKEVQSSPIQAAHVKEASSKPSPPKEVQSCPIQAAPVKEVSSKPSPPKEVQSSPIQAAPVKVISSETSPPKEAQSSPIQAAPSPPKEVQSSPIQAAPAKEVYSKPSPPKEIQDCPIQPPSKEVSSEPSPPLKTAPKKSDQCPPKEVTQPSEEKIAPPTQIELQKVVPPTTGGPSTPTQQVSIPASADTSNTGAASPVVSSEVPPPIAPPPRKSGGNKKQGKSKK